MAADPRDLCTVADVVKLVPGYAVGDDAPTDLLLQELVTRESRDFMEQTGREIKTIASLTTRAFDVDQTLARRRRLTVGDLVSVSSITVADIQGTALGTVASTDYRLLPKVREDWQPYAVVWFPTNTISPVALLETYVITIVGVWGFASVPVTVKDAVAAFVIVDYLNDVTQQGTDFSEAINRVQFNLGAMIRTAIQTRDRFTLLSF